MESDISHISGVAVFNPAQTRCVHRLLPEQMGRCVEQAHPRGGEEPIAARVTEMADEEGEGDGNGAAGDPDTPLGRPSGKMARLRPRRGDESSHHRQGRLAETAGKGACDSVGEHRSSDRLTGCQWQHGISRCAEDGITGGRKQHCQERLGGWIGIPEIPQCPEERQAGVEAVTVAQIAIRVLAAVQGRLEQDILSDDRLSIRCRLSIRRHGSEEKTQLR